MSWLNTTVGDANESILRAQVEYLQEELDKVNGQLDSNFSRLEEAGLGSVALAEKLAAALAKIGELEDEIRALLQKDKSAMVHVRQAKRYVPKVQELTEVMRNDFRTLWQMYMSSLTASNPTMPRNVLVFEAISRLSKRLSPS